MKTPTDGAVKAAEAISHYLKSSPKELAALPAIFHKREDAFACIIDAHTAPQAKAGRLDLSKYEGLSFSMVGDARLLDVVAALRTAYTSLDAKEAQIEELARKLEETTNGYENTINKMSGEAGSIIDELESEIRGLRLDLRGM